MAYSCFGLGFSLWLFARLTSVKAQWCVLALACGPLLASIGWFTVHDGFGQVAGASTRVHAFADIPDSQFLNEQERNAQQELLPIFKGEPCLFVFPNEPAWYYLLQKPACNRFYFTVHAEGDDDQREVVRALAGAAPRYIVYSSPISREVDEIPNSTRLPTLTAWLTEHYAPFRSVAGWQIYQRK